MNTKNIVSKNKIVSLSRNKNIDLQLNSYSYDSFSNLMSEKNLKIKQIISHLQKNWIWIIAILTFFSIIHSYWYFNTNFTSDQIINELKEKAILFKNKSNSYKLGSLFYYYLHKIFYSGSGLISFIGILILLSEFNYQVLFKNLFVDEGRKGKYFYIIVLGFFYVFIYLCLNPLFGSKLQKTGITQFITNFWIIAMLIYSYFAYVSESYNTIQELALQKTKAELVALKAQINPHFLFNVLNNLYGQSIIEDSPKTALGIERLSRIMRHVVEETKTEHSPIEKEIRFLEDFIELQKMRIPDRPNIKINTEIDWDGVSASIAPLLVIPYVENAFKYGISINQESFIDLNLKIENRELVFICKNSIIKTADKLEIGTSTGLENTKKRLELYYPHKHELAISTQNNVFEVIMKLKLKP